MVKARQSFRLFPLFQLKYQARLFGSTLIVEQQDAIYIQLHTVLRRADCQSTEGSGLIKCQGICARPPVPLKFFQPESDGFVPVARHVLQIERPVTERIALV